MKSVLIKLGLSLAFLAVIGGVSAYFAFSDKGAIDVRGQIQATNQDGFTTKVSPDARSNMPNGGLNPAGGQETPKPPTPEPIATTSPETASSTEATTTPEAVAEDAAPEGESAAEPVSQ